VGTQASESIGSSFADVLSQAATKTVNTLQGAEQMSIQALKGDADTRQVVDAVLSAQQALQTTIAIRDKVVSAYLEMSRMSI
ncbi:MAG: flagellar hook-basal body complex protein FliE, partial [Mesorhizobium sp.]